jgi:hypothetical protein
MEQIVYLSLAIAAISFTVTEMKPLLPLREWVKRKNSFLGELLSCGYCFGHWTAFGLVAVYQPKLFIAWWLIDFFLTALLIAWLSAFQWIFMCWLVEKTGK